MRYNTQRGFTLIELLVVVLIIGILSAIAVPQYQKAVLKSRFSSLMPTTKSIADGQEMYYMTNGRYADALAKLDVTAANTDDMNITLSDDSDYAYTMATRPNINNNLIMYQKHSANFPGEIHCEALKGNKHAEWLCGTALHGTPISGSVTEGYNTYILEGSGSGFFGGSDEGPSCDNALSMGYSCELITDENGNVTQKKMCSESGVCSIYDYTENGYNRTTCQLNANNVCQTKWIHTYDADGNKISQRKCQSVKADGTCSAYATGTYSENYNYVYDEDGKLISQRRCSSVKADGSCSAYSDWGNYDYTYDDEGRILSQRLCKKSTIGQDGTCSEHLVGGYWESDDDDEWYVSYESWDYEYDADGNLIVKKFCQSENSSGVCSSYNGIDGKIRSYDEQGRLTSEKNCFHYNADYNDCVSENDRYGNRTYIYDDDGKLIGTATSIGSTNASIYDYNKDGTLKSRVSCDKYNYKQKTCSSYFITSNSNEYYMYDNDGRISSMRRCAVGNSDTGECTQYKVTGNYDDYQYDTKGNVITESVCSTVDGSTGACTSYLLARTYTYDDEGNRTSQAECKTWNTAKTECTAWKTPTYY